MKRGTRRPASVREKTAVKGVDSFILVVHVESEAAKGREGRSESERWVWRKGSLE